MLRYIYPTTYGTKNKQYMLRFEQYLEQFSNEINIVDFLIGFLLTTLLSLSIRTFYIRFGDAISNRKRFSNNFLPLALVIMLIITVVKSSLALSLGLVGALSIVRFRAAIKDPEELVYLFMVIGLGLAMGAGQFIIALVSIPLILFLLWLYKRFNGKTPHEEQGSIFLNIQTDTEDLNKITSLLLETFSSVSLKRMDTLSKGLDLSFSCKADDFQQIERITKQLKALSNDTKVSVIDQPNLVW
ncbi:MAG: DUF4956 domain-containing protein [Bacteroidota bacterium]